MKTKVRLYLTRDRKKVTTDPEEAGFLLTAVGHELDEKLLRNLGLLKQAQELALGEVPKTETPKAAEPPEEKTVKAPPEDKAVKAAPEDKR